MEEAYGPDIITISDEDGVEYELEVLAELEYEGSTYLALTPADAEEPEEMEVSILRREDDADGEPVLSAVEDEQELENVYAALMDLMYEDDDPV